MKRYGQDDNQLLRNKRKNRVVDDSDDGDTFEQDENDATIISDSEAGDEAKIEENLESNENLEVAQDNGGLVQDKATRELVRYMIGVHSQGKIITRDKLETLMVSVKLFKEKESQKQAKLAAAIEKCVPYLKSAFGYDLVRYDKSFQSSNSVLNYKEKEYILKSCVKEEYLAANGEYARGAVSDDIFMAYVTTCLVCLVVNLGVTEYTVLSNAVKDMGLGQCLYKGRVKTADEMIGLLCRAEYLNLFVAGGAVLPSALQSSTTKPCNKQSVVNICKEIGLGQHRDTDKAEISLGPKMYYEFDAVGVLQVFEALREGGEATDSTLSGLEKKIYHCKFQGPDEPEQAAG